MSTGMTQGGLDVAAGDLDARASYALLTSLVGPRPIAWVSTLSAAGQRNLAPHSYFNLISSQPPIIHVECRLVETVALGNGTIFFGEVVWFHTEARVMDGHRVDTRALDPVARLGGPLAARAEPAPVSPPLAARPEPASQAPQA